MIDCNTRFREFIVGRIGLCTLFLWPLVEKTKPNCERPRFRRGGYEFCAIIGKTVRYRT